MRDTRFRKLTGILFIVGAVLINIPYTLLIINFEYPDILRKPTDYILVQYQAGGVGLIFTWLAFAWVGLPILFAVIMLKKVLDHDKFLFLETATFIGFIGMVVQVVGLLRWVFVVPVLARMYVDPAAGQATREAVVVAFQAIHQYGGVVLGEHIGQFFTIIWMLMISLMMFRSPLFRPWLAWLGVVASIVFLLAQTELLATAIPGFPVVPEAGLVGSLLWLAWMIVLGVSLIRAKSDAPQ